MKLNENQLRRIIGDVLTEAKVTDEDTLNQFQAAVKTLLKLGPKVSSSLGKMAEELRVIVDDAVELGDGVETMGYDLADELDEASYTVQNLFGDGGGAAEIDLLTTIAKAYAMAKKLAKKTKASVTKNSPANSSRRGEEDRASRNARLDKMHAPEKPSRARGWPAGDAGGNKNDARRDRAAQLQRGMDRAAGKKRSK